MSITLHIDDTSVKDGIDNSVEFSTPTEQGSSCIANSTRTAPEQRNENIVVFIHKHIQLGIGFSPEFFFDLT
jgi:hypothetical protein